MKKRTCLFLVLSALALTVIAAPAQPLPLTLQPPAQTNQSGSFIQSVQDYFTVIDTNSTTFTASKGQVSIGSDFVNGANLDFQVNARYQVYKMLAVESVSRIFNGALTLRSEQIGAGINLPYHDVNLFAGVGGGYNLDDRQGYFYAAAQIEKALSTHTFAGIRIETDIVQNKQTGLVAILTGFTF